MQSWAKMNIQTLSEKDIFTKDHTDTLKGLGIIVVFSNHIIPYIKNSGYPFSPLMKNFIMGDNILTYLMVGFFLFVSGYGVSESIKAKGKEYVKSIPQKRLITTLFNFDIAIIIFLATNIILGISLDVNQIVLSFIAWDSIGNSAWYIFAILYCYLCSYVSSILFDKKIHTNACLIIFTLLYCVVISQIKDGWWYNTILCYTAGSIYSCFKEQTNKLITNNFVKCSLIVSVILFISISIIKNPIFQNISAISFVLFILILSSKFKINVKWLKWGGQKLFPLYIYQRLPMLVIATISPIFIKSHPLLYILMSAVTTILIAIIIPQFRVNNCKLKFER